MKLSKLSITLSKLRIKNSRMCFKLNGLHTKPN